jgi:dTDP-4-dehydrorhamnose 3,5-epimerase-like enzyme
MKIIKGELEGPIIIEPKVFGDDRGFQTHIALAYR